jgi:hypothetical protein
VRTFLSLVVVLTGCTPRASIAPPPCPVCPGYAPVASVEPPGEPSQPEDPEEASRVLTSLFPKHLKASGDCPKTKEPMTWVEVDDIELTNLDAGWFVPIVERRERGHFTDSDDQVRYVIRIDNCQPNTGDPLRVEAVFREWVLKPGSPAEWRRPRPVMLRERRDERR